MCDSPDDDRGPSQVACRAPAERFEGGVVVAGQFQRRKPLFRDENE